MDAESTVVPRNVMLPANWFMFPRIVTALASRESTIA